MGSYMSKSTGETSAANDTNNLQYATDLNSCKLDVDLPTFSFDSLREIVERLLEMNQEVVKKILDRKKYIWKNQELFDFVGNFFENSLKILELYTTLEKCLKSARDSQLIIHIALQRFDEEDEREGNERYPKTLDELKNFKDAGDPFIHEFFSTFESVFGQQILMLESSHLEKSKLDEKLKCTRACRKVSAAVFAATLLAALICSVVAAAKAAPTVVAALAATASIPLGLMWSWIDSLLKNYENAVKGQQEIINYMNIETYITNKDLENISVLVGKLQIKIKSLLKSADFATNDEEAMKIVVEGIKKKLVVFLKNIEELEVQADKCSQDIRRARTNTLERIIKCPDY